MAKLLEWFTGLFKKTPIPTVTQTVPPVVMTTPPVVTPVTTPEVITEEPTVSLITPELLLQFAPALGDKAADVAKILNESSIVNTPLRLAHFLAQAAHESGLFSVTTENLNYSDAGLANTWPNRYSAGRDPATKRHLPNALAKSLHRKPEAIANNTYANRMGNGSEASGDGWKFRGRGYFQLTGADNYRAYSLDEYGDLRVFNNPDLVAKPEDAIKSSIWYWKRNNLNRHADKDDVLAVSRVVNIGNANSTATPNGMQDRRDKLAKAKKLLKI